MAFDKFITASLIQHKYISNYSSSFKDITKTSLAKTFNAILFDSNWICKF